MSYTSRSDEGSLLYNRHSPVADEHNDPTRELDECDNQRSERHSAQVVDDQSLQTSADKAGSDAFVPERRNDRSPHSHTQSLLRLDSL